MMVPSAPSVAPRHLQQVQSPSTSMHSNAMTHQSAMSGGITRHGQLMAPEMPPSSFQSPAPVTMSSVQYFKMTYRAASPERKATSQEGHMVQMSPVYAPSPPRAVPVDLEKEDEEHMQPKVQEKESENDSSSKPKHENGEIQHLKPVDVDPNRS